MKTIRSYIRAFLMGCAEGRMKSRARETESQRLKL